MALDTEVCAEASSGQEAIRAAKREQPDLCLVGRELCGDRLRVVQGICRAAPRAAVVILAEDHDIDDFLDSICAGAVGYVPEAVDAERLRLVVRAIAAREAVVPRSMVLELVLQLQRSRDGLTARECQVCALLRRGHTTTEIARRLDISSITVRRHISALVHKLGVEDRAALTSPGTEPPRSLIAVLPSGPWSTVGTGAMPTSSAEQLRPGRAPVLIGDIVSADDDLASWLRPRVAALSECPSSST